jgi:hypothetical protein
MKVTEARRSFFVEDEGARDAFARQGWRGAMLYRDAYGWRGLPPVLWNALRETGGKSGWWICGYAAADVPEPDAIPFSFEWDSWLDMPDGPARKSREWVVYNAAQTIAVLVEYDATIVGATLEIADEIDQILQMSATSLRQLTQNDFPDADRLEGFIKAVTK